MMSRERDLAAQSQQLVVELTPTLTRLLELVPPVGTVTTWQLRLKFFSLNPEHRPPTRAAIPAILRAFAVLAGHAQRLYAFPTVHMQFWLDVLHSDMAYGDTTCDALTYERTQLQSTRRLELVFVVDFGGYKRDPSAFVLDAQLEDALVAFMTTPSSELEASLTATTTATTTTTRTVSPLSSRSHTSIGVGFVFTSCNLDVASLETLERVFDRACASLPRLLELRLLDMSDDCLTSPALNVLARIVRKSILDYGVEQLRLDRIIPAYMTDSSTTMDQSDSPPAAVLDIARTVFGIDTLPTLASRPSSIVSTSTSPCSRLRHLSMSRNYMCLELFAMRFSALRYGSALEDDVTMYLTTNYLENHQQRPEDYVRWLAFGLFFPRPQRFARRFRLRTIGHVDHSPLTTATITRTLHNPAAELIFNGTNEHGGSDVAPTTELLVCVVKAGARVEVFQTGKTETPSWTDTLPVACELEAIYERADGTLCVVLPGVGLGWVQPQSVDRIEREPLSSERREQDGRFAGGNTQWHADRTGMWDPTSLRASMASTIETVGNQFDALDCGHTALEDGLLPHLLKCCSNLTRLTLGYQSVPTQDSAALLDALDGSGGNGSGSTLGDRLQVLNVNDFGKTTNAFYDRLFSILNDVRSLPMLHELRISGRYLNVKQLEMLHSVLQVKPQLALVELQIEQWHAGARMSKGTSNTILGLKERMNAAFQGQVLRAALPIHATLAFLSVVKARADNADSDGQALDAWVLSRILAFATDRHVRRVLVWNEVMRPGGRGNS